MMRAENQKTKPRKKSKKKFLRRALALAVVLIVLVFLFVPMYVSSEKGRTFILAKINNAVEGRTDFADLSMGWLKGIKVADFSFDDKAGRIAVRIKQIATKPHYRKILFGNLSFGETTIDQPRVRINLKAKQPTDAAPVPKSQPEPPKAAALALVSDIVVTDGNLKITDAQARTAEVSRINSKVSLRPPGRQTSFDMDMAVLAKDGESKIHADGRITPAKAKTGWTLKGTTGDLNVHIDELDIESLAPFFALAGVEVQTKGRVTANLKSEIKDGRIENLAGAAKGKDLDITGPGLKGDRLRTSDLDVDVKLTRKDQALNIDNLKVATDWANVTAKGAVPTTLKSFEEFLEPDSDYDLQGTFDCDLAAVMSQMPATLGLKEGVKISSGRLTGDIQTSTEAGQRQIQGHASLTGLQGTVEGKKVALSQPVNLQTLISSDKTGITFDELNVSASFVEFDCNGTTELLKYHADVDLQKLQSELGQFADLGEYRMAGQLLSDGQVSIKENIISAVGSAEAKNFRLSSKEDISVFEPFADVSFAFDIDRPNDIAVVDTVKAVASFGRVGIKDAILPLNEKAKKPMHLVVEAKGVDLKKLQPFAVMFASFPREMQLAGLAESNISINSEKKDTYRIKTESTKIKNLKLIYPEQKPFDANQVTLAFDAEINSAQKAVNIRELRLDSPQIKIYKARFTKTSEKGITKLQGQADFEYDWEAVGAFAGPYMPPGLRLVGKNKLPVEFSTEYPDGQSEKLFDNLSTKGKLGFEEAHYMGLNFGPTEAQLKIEKGFCVIEPFSTTVNEGQFNFAAEADLKQKSRLLKTPRPMQMMKDIKINNETANKLLMYVNPIFANCISVEGVANFGCRRLAIPLAETNSSKLETEGTIAIDNLKLRPEGLLGELFSLLGVRDSNVYMTIHPTKFALRDGFLRYDDMQVDVGDNPVNFRGVIGLDKSLDMTITLPFTLAGRTARIGKETVGKRISLSLTGTIDRPELDTSKILENQLKDLLREGLDRLLK